MPPKVKRIMTQPIVSAGDSSGRAACMGQGGVIVYGCCSGSLQEAGTRRPGRQGSSRRRLPRCASPLPPALQNLIFRFLQSRQKIQIWLYEQTDLRIEGRIIVSAARRAAAAAAAASLPAAACTHACAFLAAWQSPAHTIQRAKRPYVASRDSTAPRPHSFALPTALLVCVLCLFAQLVCVCVCVLVCVAGV